MARGSGREGISNASWDEVVLKDEEEKEESSEEARLGSEDEELVRVNEGVDSLEEGAEGLRSEGYTDEVEER